MNTLLELLEESDSMAYVQSGTVDPAPGRVLQALSLTMQTRLARMSPTALEVVRVAAVLGDTFRLVDVSELLSHSAFALIGPVAELQQAGLILQEGSRLSFRHPLVREAVRLSIPLAWRHAMHREAARVLIASGAPEADIAAQFLLAHGITDGETVNWLVSSAPILLEQAPDTARQLLSRAWTELPPGDALRFACGCRLIDAMLCLGRGGEAVDTARQVLATASRPPEIGEVAWKLGDTLQELGRTEEARAVTRDVLRRVDLPAPWLGRLQALDALLMVWEGRFEEAVRTAAGAEAIGRQAGDRITTVRSLLARAVCRELFQASEEVLDLTGQALEQLAANDEGPTAESHPPTVEGISALPAGVAPIASEETAKLLALRMVALAERDDIHEAREVAIRVRERIDRFGGARPPVVQIRLACFLWRTGQWEDAIAETQLLLRPATQAGPFRRAAEGLHALLSVHRDERRACADLLEGAPAGEAVRTLLERRLGHYMVLARAQAAEQAGRPELALELLALGMDPVLSPMLEDRWAWLPDIVRLAIEVGKPDLATEASRICALDSTDRSSPHRAMAALHCTSLLTGDPAPLQEAASYFAYASRPHQQGRALEDAAVLLARADQPGEARTALGEALRIYEDLTARWDIRRATARAAATGLRLGGVVARRRSSVGWENLTPREESVAQLVAHGRSNEEIAAAMGLSPRTVQTYVSRILGKLSARNRAEIAREVALYATASSRSRG
ncbi:LuxR C-terminal-related transcriptional regulator [Streptomyces sp. NPDC054841]